VAAESPGDVLRNAQTIQLFQRLPSVAGQPSPLLQYFGTLLEKGILLWNIDFFIPFFFKKKKMI